MPVAYRALIVLADTLYQHKILNKISLESTSEKLISAEPGIKKISRDDFFAVGEEMAKT